MSSTWISMPVENAKEVVQRQIQALSGTLTNYTSSTVTYEADCEVYFDTNYCRHCILLLSWINCSTARKKYWDVKATRQI